MRENLAIVLASGGLDSCVTVARAALENEIALLHVSYGQRTEARERQAFLDIAQHFKVPSELQLMVDIGYLSQIGGSSLTDLNEEIEAGDLERKEVPRSYVPFRNGNLIAIAASWAEVIGASSLWLGVVEEDSSGYPDCREGFMRSMEKAVNEGRVTDQKLKICTPLIQLKKSGIVRLGRELKAPLELSWSCYQAEQKACGRCDSCLLRLRGFEEAKDKDPIPYETESMPSKTGLV
jgi:7-cyano-7-deazaguanine synthase